ncbi:hypothetical protein KFK09_008475 [Dendrobium nobile]|uniref:Uncharacterized protein n=1 Tax=Dendrobium nobile TaxID=94219 RepID=A0A8T3BL81_DENNO|nr:hypothetical protein KFK09_008475 [Dendrobium nobile]
MLFTCTLHEFPMSTMCSKTSPHVSACRDAQSLLCLVVKKNKTKVSFYDLPSRSQATTYESRLPQFNPSTPADLASSSSSVEECCLFTVTLIIDLVMSFDSSKQVELMMCKIKFSS